MNDPPYGTERSYNLFYGVGHQSPDYQWWHAQPVLDGDLIRIRDIVARSRHDPAPRDSQITR